MNLTLDILKKSEKDYIFQMQFENNSLFDCNLPITEICNSIDRVGFIISHNQSMINPIDIEIYTLKDSEKKTVKMTRGQKHTLQRNASIELIQEKYWSLLFKNARYLVNPYIEYEIYVHWDLFKSNKVRWSFEIPKQSSS